MITYLKGMITEMGENTVVLEAYGIGYEIFCSTRTIGELSNHTDTIKLLKKIAMIYMAFIIVKTVNYLRS